MESIGGKGKGAPASMLTELRRKRTLFRSYDPSNAKNFQSVNPLDIVQFQNILIAYSEIAHKKLLEEPVVYPLFLMSGFNTSLTPYIEILRILTNNPQPITLYFGNSTEQTLTTYNSSPPYEFLIDLCGYFTSPGSYSVGINTLDSLTGLQFNGAYANINLFSLSNLQTLFLYGGGSIANSNYSGFTSLQSYQAINATHMPQTLQFAGLQNLSNIVVSYPYTETLDVQNCSNLQSIGLAGCLYLSNVMTSGNYPNLSYINTIGVGYPSVNTSLVAILPDTPGTWDADVPEPEGVPDSWTWNSNQTYTYTLTADTVIQQTSAGSTLNCGFLVAGAGAGGTDVCGGGAGASATFGGLLTNLTFPISISVGLGGGVGSNGGTSSVTDANGRSYYATGGVGTQGGTAGSTSSNIQTLITNPGVNASGNQGGVYPGKHINPTLFISGGNANSPGLQGLVVVNFF